MRNIDDLAEMMASGDIPVDPSEAFDKVLADLSGSAPLIDDQTIKDSYMKEMAERLQERMDGIDAIDLDGLYNYAVHANRPVRMRVDSEGASFLGTPKDFGRMAEEARIPEAERPDVVRKLAKTAMSGESFSEGGVAAERVKPIGPTPKSPSLKKAFACAALATSLLLSSMSAPNARTMEDLIPAAGGAQIEEVMPATGGAKAGDITKSKRPDHLVKLERALLSAPFASMGAGAHAGQIKAVKDACEDPVFAEGSKVMETISKKCEGKDFKGKLQAILDFWNGKVKYMTDDKNYGKPDFWATPSQTLEKGKGDCEDYALAYMGTALGMGLGDASTMRIFLVHDRNSGNQGHAITGIYHEGNLYFLDNQHKKVMTDKELSGRYTVAYSLNAKRSFTHVMSKQVMAELDRTHPIKNQNQVRKSGLSDKVRKRLGEAIKRSNEPTALGRMIEQRRMSMR